MGSVGNDPNPWAPYSSNSRSCSQGICTVYCPQFCYFFFPPPPEPNDDSTPFSPLIIAVIGVLASAFLLVSYYTVVTRYCKRRPNHAVHAESQDQTDGPARDASWAGLDESLIRAIAVCEYKKGDGPVTATECAVCLGRFHENVVLRLLPKCGHAFHLTCIDTWLRSHSNCPLCRADVDPRQSQRPADLVLAVDGRAAAGSAGDDCEEENGGRDIETRGEVVGPGRFGRSVSLRVLASGVEENGDGDSGMRRQVEMKRSASTGGLVLNEGKSFILAR